MRALATLRKLAQAEIDGLRRALGEVEAARAANTAAQTAHAAALAHEAALAVADLTALRIYPAYAGRARAQSDALRSDDARLAAEAEALRARIAEAYVTLKTYQRAAEAHAARTEAAQARADQAAADERAVQQAARRG